MTEKEEKRLEKEINDERLDDLRKLKLNLKAMNNLLPGNEDIQNIMNVVVDLQKKLKEQK